MEVNLGYIPDRLAQRDAVHVAVIPLIAGETLHPGDKFKLAYGKDDTALRADYNAANDDGTVVGVVDPFMKGWDGVEQGERFWGFLFPGTVTGMRHHWKHPSFGRENVAIPKDEHEKWLREFCDKWNFDWSQLIDAATETNEESDWRYVVAQGRDLHSAGELGEDHDKFWEHLEGYTDKTFDAPHREGMGWSCSC